MRIILAGIAGGIAMFIWSFRSHTVLPLGEVACFSSNRFQLSLNADRVPQLKAIVMR